MTAGTGDTAPSTACVDCLRRSWLLDELSPLLDFQAHNAARLIELLALSDHELVQALAGRRRAELSARYERFEPGWLETTSGTERCCRHDPRYPALLDGEHGPRMLHVAGSLSRLAKLTATPVVAILGATQPTDYGLAIAKDLVRGLCAAGVTVASGWTGGVADAAQQGALEVGGGTIAVTGDGLEVVTRKARSSLYRRVGRAGCAVSELPCAASGRRWGALAGQRILARLAVVIVVVEAEDGPAALTGARLAQALGRTVAAVPGRVTSRLSGGTHSLLRDGAPLVAGPADVLDLLYGADATAENRLSVAGEQLDHRLRATLELVGSGTDTAAQLVEREGDATEVLSKLSELELLGLLVRGQGGRYVPRDPLTDWCVR